MRHGATSADLNAALWAIACCWLAVGGNYLLIAFGLKAAWIVPFDLFAVPALMTAVFWLLRRT
jgi:hypothetical protein